MAVIFGSARISETGRINGAKGDQTGREVGTENFYVHPQGWVILRAKSAVMANKLAVGMLKICNNNKIGYGQNDRITSYNEARKYGFDASKIVNPVNTDCSEAVRICVAYAGVKIPDIYTGNEKAVLLSTGQFDEVPFTSAANLYNGDILVTLTRGHTGIICGNAKKRIEPKPTVAKPTQPASKALNSNGVKYQAHCQTFGWLPEVRDGMISGTVGASKRLEAIKLALPKGATAVIRAHIQGTGWKEYIVPADGSFVTIGTTGLSKRLESIEITSQSGLDGKELKVRAHCQTLGWSNWGAQAGTIGFSKRVEAVQFVIE